MSGPISEPWDAERPEYLFGVAVFCPTHGVSRTEGLTKEEADNFHCPRCPPLRPWLNWTERQTTDLETGGSNPPGRTSHPDTK